MDKRIYLIKWLERFVRAWIKQNRQSVLNKFAGNAFTEIYTIIGKERYPGDSFFIQNKPITPNGKIGETITKFYSIKKTKK